MWYSHLEKMVVSFRVDPEMAVLFGVVFSFYLEETVIWMVALFRGNGGLIWIRFRKWWSHVRCLPKETHEYAQIGLFLETCFFLRPCRIRELAVLFGVFANR